LRDELLDAGLLVETLETSATWTTLPVVHDTVAAVLAAALLESGTVALVGAHVSHLYRHGASLYFTVLARRAADPVRQWTRAKAAATEALLATGATITHHHAVGRDHRGWLPDEVGELGVRVLSAVKDVLDPSGVCNPGVLLQP
jgi:alkyldihydroxyacetonephosphate synthase